MLRQPSFYLLLFVFIFSSLLISNTTPPDAVDNESPDSVFSAIRAKVYLKEITKVPHSTGTTGNAQVREYIVSICKQIGLETEIQSTTVINSFDRGLVAGKVYNVIAQLKGLNSTKAVLIMAHYDSQPNALGAGDDGAGVAAMLEVARILKSGKPLQNDVLFLFTDAEEDGLLGAQAFVKENPLLKNVGLVLNFEGRGNAGISTMFEVNPENGWAVKEYIKAAKHPAANSLSFEVYKNLPNDTDYTIFKRAGITGLNSAFVDGFVNYHSMTDDAENLDPRSLQNHGDNMMSLTKHFGNLNLTQTKGADISYFEMMGIGMIHYPATWDKIFTAIVILLFIAFVILGIRKNQITIKGFLAGLFIFIALLVLLIFSSFYFLKGVKSIYPQYLNFYEANAYNAHYYFLALTALTVMVFGLVYQWAIRKFTASSLLAGIIFTDILFMGLMYMEMPTATYVMSFPLLVLLSGSLLLVLQNNSDKQPIRTGLTYLVFLLPSLLLLIPTTYFMFIAFGLGQQAPGAVLLAGIVLGLLLPLFAGLLKSHRYMIPFASLLVCIIALVMAHVHSGFTEKQPFQTNTWYALDADNGKAQWFSSVRKPDFWNSQFFSASKIDTVMGRIRLVNDAPLLALTPPLITIQHDTIENEKRKIKLHCQSMRGAISFSLDIGRENLPERLTINGKETDPSRQYAYVNFVGLDSLGVDIELEAKPETPLDITITDRTIGLPTLAGYSTYTTDVIPGPGYNSNSTQVMKRYQF